MLIDGLIDSCRECGKFFKYLFERYAKGNYCVFRLWFEEQENK